MNKEMMVSLTWAAQLQEFQALVISKTCNNPRNHVKVTLLRKGAPIRRKRGLEESADQTRTLNHRRLRARLEKLTALIKVLVLDQAEPKASNKTSEQRHKVKPRAR